jgi:hypothetical protein
MFTVHMFNRSLSAISKIFTFTADNASNNDTLVNELSNLIPTFGGQQYQICYFAHILNLVVKVSGVFGLFLR